ncbi:hypothetical protein F8568_024810 [Actinomadura sp. LD22]|uniref:EthD family reductase n=1 Tax=Actinomadura physcomitrii TaxID=2650748 RepID=A0A6I4MG41_9ACTN|nr:DUF4286 family protein [Actinomadura physcomitrii]MWA03545.1 hypothetical protein [Actinomadura physcomitrii]
MPKRIMVVQSGPSDPAREDEYNEWYSGTHMPQVRAVPGFVSARRFKLQGDADPSLPPYLAIYEIEADEPDESLKELRRRSAAGEIETSDVLRMDPPPAVAFYEPIE